MIQAPADIHVGGAIHGIKRAPNVLSNMAGNLSTELLVNSPAQGTGDRSTGCKKKYKR
jgi:hypothetical protein